VGLTSRRDYPISVL